LDAAAGARIIEVGALKLAGGKVTDHFLTLVDPGIPVPADATAVHGLTDADLAGQPKIADIFPAFVTFLGDGALVAHNLKFDLSFLARTARELGLRRPGNATIDLIGLARHYRPGLASYALENLAARAGILNPAPHRALGDAAVASELFLSFWELAQGRGDAATVGDFVVISHQLAGPVAPVETLVTLDWAAAGGEPLEIIYHGAAGARRRLITPLGIKSREGVAAVKAYCHERRARRYFRLDRLTLAPAADAEGRNA